VLISPTPGATVHTLGGGGWREGVLPHYTPLMAGGVWEDNGPTQPSNDTMSAFVNKPRRG